MKTRKIGLANYLAYGAGDFLGAGTTALTAAWLLYFYTTFCGLTPIEATLIFAAARVLDAVVSPLMGFLTDNFGTTWLGKRFGRRKFFILLGIPCVFSYSAMWVGEMGFWYYLVTYLLFDMVYTMILVPYETLVPEMTDDFKQKTKFSGARISMAQMSAILASFLPGILLTWLGKDNASSFFYASLVFSVLCAVMLTFVWCFTWERPREAWSEAALRAEAEKQNLTLAQSLNRLVIELSSTLRIKIFRQHLGMYLGGYIAQDVFNAVFTYYVVFVLMQEASVASNLLGTMAIFQFIAVIAMIPLCIRFGPAPSYRMVVVLFGLSSLSYALLYYAGLSDVYSLLLLISAVAGLGRGGINYVPWNTYLYCRRRRGDHRPAPRRNFCRHHDADPQSLAGGGGHAGGHHHAAVGVCLRAKNTTARGESYHFADPQRRHSGGVSLRLPRLATLQAQPAHPQHPAQ